MVFSLNISNGELRLFSEILYLLRPIMSRIIIHDNNFPGAAVILHSIQLLLATLWGLVIISKTGLSLAALKKRREGQDV